MREHSPMAFETDWLCLETVSGRKVGRKVIVRSIQIVSSVQITPDLWEFWIATSQRPDLEEMPEKPNFERLEVTRFAPI